MITEKQLRASLAKLGKAQKDIRAALKRRKIKGDRQDDTSCPLANYLVREFPKEEEFSVGDEITVNGATIECPNHFSTFIENFDAGEYPELDNDPVEENESD